MSHNIRSKLKAFETLYRIILTRIKLMVHQNVHRYPCSLTLAKPVAIVIIRKGFKIWPSWKQAMGGGALAATAAVATAATAATVAAADGLNIQ